MEKDKIPKETGEITRREFLKDAGLVVGGAAIGSTVLLAACGGETETVTATETVTTTAPGATSTVTTTAPGETVTSTATETAWSTTTTTATTTDTNYVCPYCGATFDSLSELKAHCQAEHPAETAVEGLSTLTVNGKQYSLNIEPNWSLMYVLREKLGLVGTKNGCDRGECGTCAVIMDGKSVFSCMVLAIEAVGHDILTIEGLSDGITLHPMQQAFVNEDAIQCGYCVPGFILCAKALLDENPNPTFDEIREGLSGHICTCGNDKKMVEAVLAAKGGS